PAKDPKGIGGKLGEIVAVEADGFKVVCADGRFKITRVQPVDGKKLEAGAWAVSAGLKPGGVLDKPWRWPRGGHARRPERRTGDHASRSAIFMTRRRGVPCAGMAPRKANWSESMAVRSDIEIARDAKMKPIAEVGKRIGIPDGALLNYGPYKAKVSFDFINDVQRNKDGRLILVTAITPTPAGEGKTTTTVGLGDGLNRIAKKAMSCLREPSLGPCFGVKGGA